MKSLGKTSAYPLTRNLRRKAVFLQFAGLAVWLLAATESCSLQKVFGPGPALSNHPTEQRWIIGSIARDLTDLATFAADSQHWNSLPADALDVRESGGGMAGDGYTVSIKLPGDTEFLKSELPVKATPWTPELYTPVLTALFTRLKISPPADGSDPVEGEPAEVDLLKALTNPLTAGMEAQNERLSTWLQAHPLDAPAHEQAALLLGTLAMRENSGLFWNPRGLCNRAAAHLAFARALRPAAVSESGEVAELLIGLIIDTKADCQKRIAALREKAAAHPELGPWATAAALRNTRDYRLLPDPKNATLLERIELFRALSEAIGTEQAIRRMENHDPDTAPDWSRIVLQGGFGVEAGHQFALPSIGSEMSDAAQVLPDAGTARTPDQFATAFNPPPGGPVQTDADRHARLRVIDRGTWAQFFQRHLLQASDETYNFLQNLWAVRDEAKSFRVQMAPLLRRLTLYPLCLKNLGKEDGDAIFPQAADLWNQHPEWVGDRAWANLVKTVPAQYAKNGSWSEASGNWFTPRLPSGTVYGFDWRAEVENNLPAPAQSDLQKYYDIAPLKYDVCRLYLNASTPDHHFSVEQYKRVMGPLLGYYLPAMWGEAWLVQNDPAQYGSVMNEAAALNPNYYSTLGKYYVTHHMEPEAAQAYQAAIDHEADAVSVANSSGWLVNYYFDHDQKDRAMTVAKYGAEVYSSMGLETMGHLLERMGRDEEAESYYEKIDERYQDAKPLHAFYALMASSKPQYLEKMKAAVGEIFPQGMEEVSLEKLKGKPTKGVMVNGENDLTKQAGLKPGAIIVGLDGKRVRNFVQYTYVRALKDSPEMDLVVYQDEHYQAIRASVPGRFFKLKFTTWP